MTATSSRPRRGIPRRPLRAGNINAERFWSYVEVRGPDDCWPWKGATSGDYGLFRVGGRAKFGAHRVAFALEHGEAPVGLLVCHTCDNGLCCNQAHLGAGTHAENSDEARARGRHERTRKALIGRNHARARAR